MGKKLSVLRKLEIFVNSPFRNQWIHIDSGLSIYVRKSRRALSDDKVLSVFDLAGISTDRKIDNIEEIFSGIIKDMESFNYPVYAENLWDSDLQNILLDKRYTIDTQIEVYGSALNLFKIIGNGGKWNTYGY